MTINPGYPQISIRAFQGGDVAENLGPQLRLKFLTHFFSGKKHVTDFFPHKLRKHCEKLATMKCLKNDPRR